MLSTQFVLGAFGYDWALIIVFLLVVFFEERLHLEVQFVDWKGVFLELTCGSTLGACIVGYVHMKE